MVNKVKSIPSSNLPLTTESGTIHPIWYEYFRSFISSVSASSGTGTTTNTVVAGDGIDGTGLVSTVNVGAGNGIKVNTNDVAVDITGQVNAQAAVEDEIMIADASDGSRTRKTSIQDVVNLAGSKPAGNDTNVQYNNNDNFGGDSGFTYDGAGNAYVSTTLEVNGVVITGGATKAVHFDGAVGLAVPRIQSDGGGGYKLYADQVGSDTAYIELNASSPQISFISGVSGSSTVRISATEGFFLSGTTNPLRRAFHSNVTANVTQTQGNSALTGDYCNVTTVANDNDVVTLPAALIGRYCTVRNAGANILQVYPISGDDLGFGTNVSTTIRPGEHMTWFAIDTTTWHQTDGLLRHTVKSGITASTTQSQGQQPLTQDVNEISVVANANDTVTLPSATAYSRTITIINNGANTMQIFPASGDNLGAGVDTATTLAAGSNVQFVNYNVTNWEIT